MSRPLVLVSCLVAVLAGTLVLGLAPADGAAAVRVVDGDTMSVDGAAIRLFGIDAPEMDQRCDDAAGAVWDCAGWARDELSGLLGGAVPACRTVDMDRHGRAVAICTVGATDLGDEMVRRGAAIAYRAFSDRYVEAEAAAQAAGRGLWSGEFVMPAEWRARDVDPAPGDCDIKGNISANGQIYHLPGSRAYAGTRIDTARGERWFCSVEEAEAAGWRAAR